MHTNIHTIIKHDTYFISLLCQSVSTAKIAPFTLLNCFIHSVNETPAFFSIVRMKLSTDSHLPIEFAYLVIPGNTFFPMELARRPRLIELPSTCNSVWITVTAIISMGPLQCRLQLPLLPTIRAR